MTERGAGRGEVFKLYFIQPSHYDDDGYVIQWLRSEIPSNSMALMNGIAFDCVQRRVLGEDVEIEISTTDETNTRVRPRQIVEEIRRAGGKGLVAVVGVQSNQFPRAMDISRPLREAGIPVCIGGFHVSGCQAMLPELPADIQEAMDCGISLFAGEAEGRFEEVLRDAHAGRQKPLYNYMAELPDLTDVPLPMLARGSIERTVDAFTSFDSGRGCPFQCSFCTIINVQGRKSRYRSADDVERIIRQNNAQGIRKFFITDDNFARNSNWEAIFDRLIHLREVDGIDLKLIIQVDTLCHRVEGFIEKAARAGLSRVFIGLENINPENLLAAQKRQNRITEYREMLQAWKRAGVMTYCGYILGFPGDTPERVLNDIEILKRELPIDLLEFFCLTPLPGSQDHKELAAKGVAMDPDMNKYDLEHVCTAHPKMSRREFQDLYDSAWHAFYSDDHVEAIIRRALASGMRPNTVKTAILEFYGCHLIEGVHPLQGGLFRRKYRRDRRHGMTLENPLIFYPRYAGETALKFARFWLLKRRYDRILARVLNDPERERYMDLSIAPIVAEELDELEMFSASASAKAAVAKARRRKLGVAARAALAPEPSVQES